MASVHALFDAQVALPETADIDPNEGFGRPMGLGHREPFYELPADFQEFAVPTQLKEILNPDSFFAGVFRRGGKSIGLLRIPSYSVKNIATLPLAINFFVGALNRYTEELIIDQMNNPGGFVVFSDLLLQALVGKLDTERHMKFAIKPSQQFLRSLIGLRDELQKGELEAFLPPREQKELLEETEKSIALIIDARAKGLPLTEPISLLPQTRYFAAAVQASLASLRARVGEQLEQGLGFDIFSPQVYDADKRVSFVINELDFSGGDATPAGFQDYGRGELVGVRTAGAGGTVEQFEQREVTEYQYRLTTSLMVRPDGRLVENYGVTPDVPFEITPHDYREGHKNVFERLLRTLGHTAPEVTPEVTPEAELSGKQA